jgi:hypothetical protein
MTESGITSDIYEMWSLPWHALHRNIASELVAGAVEFSGIRPKYLHTPSGALHANTWLSRARRRMA